jgi:hypothetical protein
MTIPLPMSSCAICPLKPECIRCSVLAQYDKKHPERIRELVRSQIWRKRIQTPEMAKGTADHKLLELSRNLDTNPESIFRRIRDHERFYFSLTVCSVRYGLRGTPDAVLAEWKGNILKLGLIDDKTHLEGRYFTQVRAYALILTDPNCLYTTNFSSDEEEAPRVRFYDQIGYPDTEISYTLNPYVGKGQVLRDDPLPPRLFSRSNIPEEKWQVFSVLRVRKNILQAYMSPQLLASSQQLRFSKRTGGLVGP